MKRNKFWAAAGRTLAVMTVAFIVVLMLAPGASAAAKYKVIHKFSGPDGSDPQDGLIVFDTAGNLFATTYSGGLYGYGTVFELTPNSGGSWTETVLYSFTGGSDGAAPGPSGVIFDGNGNLYGATSAGGDYGNGTVYKLAPNSGGTWTETVLHSFGSGADGATPWAGVALDTSGNLYGTTQSGGAYGGGTVYQLTPNSDGTWTENVIHAFGSGNDGNDPQLGSVIFDASGVLYGTTHYGGPYGYGTVYTLTPQGDGSWTESVLHSFKNYEDKNGAGPICTLTFDKSGALYGTTSSGNKETGMVFKLTPGAGGKWTEHAVYRFKDKFIYNDDAVWPLAGVVFDTAGNLYGTSYYGGSSSNAGTVYKLIPKPHGGWREQMLHRFHGVPGGSPIGEVVLDEKGNIYGLASGEQVGNYGVVFKIAQ